MVLVLAVRKLGKGYFRTLFRDVFSDLFGTRPRETFFPCHSLSMFFFGKWQGKPPKKPGFFIPTERTPKVPGKEGKNAQKNLRNSLPKNKEFLSKNKERKAMVRGRFLGFWPRDSLSQVHGTSIQGRLNGHATTHASKKCFRIHFLAKCKGPAYSPVLLLQWSCSENLQGKPPKRPRFF